MQKLIRGKKITEEILEKIKEETVKLKKKGIKPKLIVILIGNDPASKIYVQKKGNTAKKLGIKFKLRKFRDNVKQDKLLKKIQKIQKRINYGGIIIQLPIPKHLNTQIVIDSIKPEFDVDCLTKENLELLKTKHYKIVPPTPGAILEILKNKKINLKNKKIVLVGYGKLVGKPLATIFKKQKLDITICTKKTKDLKKECLKADILITGVGKKHLITADMIKKGAVVIDAGVILEKGKMYGDVDYKNAMEKVKYITPTPGGVGAVTVAKLLENVIMLTKTQNTTTIVRGATREQEEIKL